MALKKMKTYRLVLVERENRLQNTVIGSSGLLLSGKYVITTANIFSDLLTDPIFKRLQPGKLHTDIFKNTSLNVVLKENETYAVNRSRVFAVFVSENIKNTAKSSLQSWAIDSVDNNRGLNQVLSLFFILALDETVSIREFKEELNRWLNATIEMGITKGQTIYTNSVPFGNRNFMNSLSKGIVSNVFGHSSCFILSDCPCSPGSEGSPAFLRLSFSNSLKKGIPIGLVLSSISWWKGEWVGLTLIADIRAMITELLDIPLNLRSVVPNLENLKVIASSEYCLVQIYSGKSWGTGILLSKEKGIFITNSHVVEREWLLIYYKGQHCEAHLLYKTPENDVFDLAIVKCDPSILKETFKLRSIPLSRTRCVPGDVAYSAGYSLFSKESELSPSLSRGCISQAHPFLIKTTCCVHPGSSGGAILDSNGTLLAVIVCNARLGNNNTVYPRVNMAIPILAVSETIFRFIETEDATILRGLHVKGQEAEFVWKKIEGKL